MRATSPACTESPLHMKILQSRKTEIQLETYGVIAQQAFNPQMALNLERQKQLLDSVYDEYHAKIDIDVEGSFLIVLCSCVLAGYDII